MDVLIERQGLEDVIELCRKNSVPVKYYASVKCPAMGIGDILERIRYYKQGYGSLPFRINAGLYGHKSTGTYYSNPINALEFRIYLIRNLLHDNGFDSNALECIVSETIDLDERFPDSELFDPLVFHTNVVSDIPDNAIIFHTKYRQAYNAEDAVHKHMIREFCKTFVTENPIVLLGEQQVPNTWEVSLHKISTVYDELCELKEKNNVIDLTTKTITDCLDYEKWKLDIERIRTAKTNITFGLGGMLCMCVGFGYNTLFFVDPGVGCHYKADVLAKHNHFMVRDLLSLFKNINERYAKSI
jgi:hypothetical protein